MISVYCWVDTYIMHSCSDKNVLNRIKFICYLKIFELSVKYWINFRLQCWLQASCCSLLTRPGWSRLMFIPLFSFFQKQCIADKPNFLLSKDPPHLNCMRLFVNSWTFVPNILINSCHGKELGTESNPPTIRPPTTRSEICLFLRFVTVGESSSSI